MKNNTNPTREGTEERTSSTCRTNDAVEDPVLQARGEDALGLDMIGMAEDRPTVEAVTEDTGELPTAFEEDSTGDGIYISRSTSKKAPSLQGQEM